MRQTFFFSAFAQFSALRPTRIIVERVQSDERAASIRCFKIKAEPLFVWSPNLSNGLYRSLYIYWSGNFCLFFRLSQDFFCVGGVPFVVCLCVSL